MFHPGNELFQGDESTPKTSNLERFCPPFTSYVGVHQGYRMVQGFQSINIHFGLKLCLASTWKQGDGGYCNAFAPWQAAELKTTAFFVPAGCCFWGPKSTYWFWEMGEWNDSYIDIYYCRSFPHSLRLAPKRMAKQILWWQSNMT